MQDICKIHILDRQMHRESKIQLHCPPSSDVQAIPLIRPLLSLQRKWHYMHGTTVSMKGYGLWCLTPLATIFQLHLYIVAVCFNSLVEETRVPRENHRPAAIHWQTLSHKSITNTTGNFSEIVLGPSWKFINMKKFSTNVCSNFQVMFSISLLIKKSIFFIYIRRKKMNLKNTSAS
jgi:hypothetical protein